MAELTRAMLDKVRHEIEHEASDEAYWDYREVILDAAQNWVLLQERTQETSDA